MINVNDFTDLIKQIVRNELGDRSQYKIATITDVSGRTRVRFAGESQSTQKRYSYLSSYTPVVGDRVLMARVKGSYVILGKLM